ncbi:hypothetical protein [Paenibacillus sp. sgz5001063]
MIAGSITQCGDAVIIFLNMHKATAWPWTMESMAFFVIILDKEGRDT